MKRRPAAPVHRAAYQVSQPLFDELRGATASIADCAKQTQIQADVLQHIHIHVHEDHGRTAIHRIVKSWADMALTYERVFRQVRDSYGEQTQHASYVDVANTMLNSVSAVLTSAKQAHNTLHSAGGRSDQTPHSFTSQLEQIKIDASRRSAEGVLAWTDNVEAAARVNETEQHASRKKRKLDNHGATDRDPVFNGESLYSMSSPRIEYQDVSREVEARLQARAEKRRMQAAPILDKKRKRRSGLVQGTTQDQTPTTQHTRKKVKAGADTLDQNTAGDAAQPVRSPMATALGNGNGASPHPRKDTASKKRAGGSDTSNRRKRKKLAVEVA